MTMPLCLDISITTEAQLFNSMDPAPFRRRELDPAVIEYIIAFAEKAPADADLGLAIRLENPPPGVDIQAIVADAVCENFRRMAATSRRKLKNLFHDGRISLVIGIGFVALAVAIGEFVTATMGNSHRAQVIADSFVIGGWVALWHPINIFLFDWWPLRREARLFDRLSLMQVRIVAG
jgi:hypothetical protein